MTKRDHLFEESLSDEWAHDLGVVEVPLDEKPLWCVGIAVLIVGALVAGRILFLWLGKGNFYAKRAMANLSEEELLPAPRGIISDRFGKTLAENRPVFSVLLNTKEFLKRRELEAATLKTLTDTLGIPPEEVWNRISERNLEQSVEYIVMSTDVPQPQLVALKAVNLPTITIADSFERTYPEGEIFSSLIGYTGLPSAEDFRRNPDQSGRDFIGKTGLEALYDGELQGKPGALVTLEDATGNVLRKEKEREPEAGQPLTLTIDADFQSYFYRRMQEGLRSLGRTTGVGLALNPQNGEVLALLSFPTFDNNIFHASGRNDERKAVLGDFGKPLFNRAITGLYPPGSTIKPLVAIAALTEGVIDPEKTIFSPGYLDIPNPYDPEHPTRYLDWRRQGNVNLSVAIAQSSNVYFYTVGGGAGDIRGLGINRLREWWQKFNLGNLTGIDLPGEAEGLLPSIEWKEKATSRPWLLGDTYNVSIGQGDLLVTPIQLLNYIAAIGNGGKLYQPVLNRGVPHPKTLVDLTYLTSEIREVQKGMREAVDASLGTAHLLADLPVSVGAKTGTAQIQNNKEENAIFVGYAPADNPQIALLVLVENARQGSLNAVPIAKDVIEWYYRNRIVKH